MSGQPPTITSAAATVTTMTPYTIQFSASATDPGGTSLRYMWDFDDGDFVYANANPIKAFPVPGTYNVHLTVVDDDGNNARTTLTVTVP